MTDTRRTHYPEIEPYETGMLDVGEGHSLYYERVGTPGAKPAVFLHGGPGGGMAPDHRRQWDPELYDVLLFDQRGCGKSLPFAEIEHNDTWRIVEDIEDIADERLGDADHSQQEPQAVAGLLSDTATALVDAAQVRQIPAHFLP